MNNFKQKRVCRHCSYDANPYNATHCEVCRYPLRSINVTTKTTKKLLTTFRWACVPLGGMLLFAAGFFLLWLLANNYTFSENPTSSSLLIPKDAPQPPSPAAQEPAPPSPAAPSPAAPASRPLPAAIAPNPAVGGIQLDNSMQEVQNVPQGLFDYAGAVTFANLTAHGMNKAIANAYPKFRLRYANSINRKPGSGTAIAMLIEGKVSFAQSARPLSDEEYSRAKARGFTLKQIPVFVDGIAFYTHPSVSVPGISLKQAQAIFQGKVTNWKQLGGPDLPIKPFSQDPKASSVIGILLNDPEGKTLGRNVQIIQDITDAIRKVASTPGGISYSSPSLAINQKAVFPLGLAAGSSGQYVPYVTSDGRVDITALQNGTYPLTRRLFVVFRQDGTLDERAGVAYAKLLLSQEGQQIIEAAGFVPLR